MKTCTQCHIEKPITEFYSNAGTPTGRRSNCKQCHNSRTTQWNHKNMDKKRAAVAKWDSEHKEWKAEYLSQRYYMHRYGMSKEDYFASIDKQQR